MKTQSLSFVVPSPRCSHLTAAGRRCRQLSADRQPGLCHHHRAVQKQKEALDHSHALLSQSQGFQTAQGLNFALGNLYKLLAANRISARRAAVLAYINSLQLRTLPAIDSDNDAGITDPTIPVPPKKVRAKSAVIKSTAPKPTAESEPDSDAKSASLEPGSTDTNSKDSAASPSDAPPSAAPTAHDPAPPSKYRSYWATIPDPNKKPS
jgi:hypothetical protein